MSFHFTRIDGSLIKIHKKFHDYSWRFVQVLFVFHGITWHGLCTCASHGVYMAFTKKMMGFPSDLMSFLTKLRSKRLEKIRVTFFTGWYLSPIFNAMNLSVFHAKTWHGFWTSSSQGISMTFAKKMMGLSSDLLSFSTKLQLKRHEKRSIPFFTGFGRICQYLFDFTCQP